MTSSKDVDSSLLSQVLNMLFGPIQAIPSDLADQTLPTPQMTSSMIAQSSDQAVPILRRKRGRPPLKQNGSCSSAPVKKIPKSCSTDIADGPDLLNSSQMRRSSRRRRAVDFTKELLVLLPGLNVRDAPQLDLRSEVEYESFLEAMLEETHSDDDEQSIGGGSSSPVPTMGLETPGFAKRNDIHSEVGVLPTSVPAVKGAISFDSATCLKTPLSSNKNGASKHARDRNTSSGAAGDSSNDYLRNYMEYDADSEDEAFMHHLQLQLFIGHSSSRGGLPSSSSRHAIHKTGLNVVSPLNANTNDSATSRLSVRLLEQMIALLERHFELSRQFHLDHHEAIIHALIEDANKINSLSQQYLLQRNGYKGSDPRLSIKALVELCSLTRVDSTSSGAMSSHPSSSSSIVNNSNSTSSTTIPIINRLANKTNPSISIGSYSKGITPNSISGAFLKKHPQNSSSRVVDNNPVIPLPSNSAHHQVGPRDVPTSLGHSLATTADTNTVATVTALRVYPVDRIAELLPFEWVQPSLRHALHAMVNDQASSAQLKAMTGEQEELLILREVYSYWIAKRSRCTTSLVRCYHQYIMDQWTQTDLVALPLAADFSIESMKTAYLYLHKIRKSLDRARLIADRVRRRERLKRDVARASSDEDDDDSDSNDDGSDAEKE